MAINFTLASINIFKGISSTKMVRGFPYFFNCKMLKAFGFFFLFFSFAVVTFDVCYAEMKIKKKDFFFFLLKDGAKFNLLN